MLCAVWLMKCVTRVLQDVTFIFCLGTDFSVPYIVYTHTHTHTHTHTFRDGPPCASRLQEAKFVYFPFPGTHAHFLPRKPR